MTNTQTTRIGPKPKFLAQDGPVEGESVVFNMYIEATDTRIAASALLGPGRDYLDMDEARTGLINAAGITSTLHGPYNTITALLADFPEAKMDGTAKRLLAVEKAATQYQADLAEWLSKVTAAGLEPCDRCGGHGGWKGWPGYTCYECNGSGTQQPEN